MFGTTIDALYHVNPYTFHINLYDLVFLGVIFIGLIFTLLLWLTKRIKRIAKLYRLLSGFGLLWLLWVPYVVVNYFYYHQQLGIPVYYLLYLLLIIIIIIGIAALMFLRLKDEDPAQVAPVPKPLPSAELMQKGIWLKKEMEANLYHQDPELSLSALAEKLGLHSRELSQII